MKNKTLFASLLTICFLMVNFVLAVTCPDATNWDNSSGVCIPTSSSIGLPDGGGTADPVATVIFNVMRWLLRIVGIIAVIGFVVAGIQYLTSAGDQNMIESAKRNTKWSIVGVIVALMGIVILNFVWTTLNNS